MGAGASKQARKLNSTTVKTASETLKNKTKFEQFQVSKPSATQESASTSVSEKPNENNENLNGKDGGDPQYADRLLELSSFDIAAQVKEMQRQSQPRYTANNTLLSAIKSRTEVNQIAEKDIDSSTSGKKYVPPQTITAILEARDNDKDSIEAIMRDFNIDSEVLRKLRFVRKPTATPAPKQQDLRTQAKHLDSRSELEGELDK